MFQTQHQRLQDFPTVGQLFESVAKPISVHLLLTGGYVNREYRGREVAEIGLHFDGDLMMLVPIVAGECIRENWSYTSTENDTVSTLEGSSSCNNVWIEEQYRGGRPARAFLDIMTIPIPEPYASSTLSSIEFIDRSVEFLGFQDPSLQIIAVTVERGI